jgi:hypothetical protein
MTFKLSKEGKSTAINAIILIAFGCTAWAAYSYFVSPHHAQQSVTLNVRKSALYGISALIEEKGYDVHLGSCDYFKRGHPNPLETLLGSAFAMPPTMCMSVLDGLMFHASSRDLSHEVINSTAAAKKMASWAQSVKYCGMIKLLTTADGDDMADMTPIAVFTCDGKEAGSIAMKHLCCPLAGKFKEI